MLTLYVRMEDGSVQAKPADDAPVETFVWADLYQPTESEEAKIETCLGVNVPTPAERAALEESARFYEEYGALGLTATLLGQRAEGPFVAEPVSFILKDGQLVTVRTIKPRAFEIGSGRASARIGSSASGAEVLLALLESVVERIADILQEIGAEAATVTALVFGPEPQTRNLQSHIRAVGRLGGLTALAHESLSSIARLVAFAAQVCEKYGLPREPLRALKRDIEELERAATAQQVSIGFLLEAALGLVGAAQNNALRAVALATIAFAPPTLIASVFGMNFEAMTWFRTGWGPFVAFGMMLAAPAALFVIARWRKWF